MDLLSGGGSRCGDVGMFWSPGCLGVILAPLMTGLTLDKVPQPPLSDIMEVIRLRGGLNGVRDV